MSRERYLRQLEGLREDLLRLGSMVEQALMKAMRCLETWDSVGAAQIIREDHEIDNAWHAVEEKTLRLMATQQPTAGDLRLIMVAVAIAGELERIGDYANTIARRVRRAVARPVIITPPSRMRDLGNKAIMMLHLSLDAFLTQDVAKAHSLTAIDEEVDELENLLRAELIAMGKSDPQTIEAVIEMVEVLRALERAADRSTNIGERVIYLATSTVEELNP